MPAVNLIHLRKEITGLLWEFTNPDGFRDGLMFLIDQYRTLPFRSGYGVLTSYQTPDLRIPQLVLRELELAIFQTVREQPQAALKLCDALWDDTNIEMHIVATRMLGQIPIEFSDEVLARIDHWTQIGLESSELRILIQNAAGLVRQKEPDRLLALAQKWCAQAEPTDQERGIQLLIFLVEDPQFINLPAVYSAIEKYLPAAQPSQQPELTELMDLLLERSRTETSFFLRQMLERPDSGKIIHRIARKLISKTSEQSRPAIQKILREKP